MNRQLPLLAVLGGAAAFFLRLWQNHSGFEADTGLPIPGTAAGILLPLFLLILAVLLLVWVRRLPQEAEGSAALPRDFSTENPRLLVLPVAGALLMGAAGLADLYEGFGFGNPLTQFLSAADPYGVPVMELSAFSPGAQKLLGVLCLLSAGALLPAISACRKGVGTEREFQTALLLVPPVALVIRLVLVYRLDSVNPVLEAYYVEVLALVFLTLGFYRLSSFAFGAGRTRTFAVYGALAVVLCLTALADGGPCLSSLLLYVGGGAVLLGFLMLRMSGSVSGQELPQDTSAS